jgi:hypothetical protein
MVDFQNAARFGRAGIEFLIESWWASPSPSFEWKGRKGGAAANDAGISETARFFGHIRASRKWGRSRPSGSGGIYEGKRTGISGS